MSSLPWLRVAGPGIATEAGEPISLRGIGIGGWLNMENFITGYAGTESLQRAALRRAMGEEAYQAFFDRFTDCFFGNADAGYLASLGLNCVRVPVNYLLLQDDADPLRVRGSGLDLLEQVVSTCAAHGIYTILDLHALPGGQNAHWHSDNPTHVASFWAHRVFQDQVVALWEQIAGRFSANPAVAGYNPVNEPADPDGTMIGPFYARLADAIRARDPRHMLFLDGNRYGTEFSMLGELLPNTVYAVHDYALPGIAAGSTYPGTTRGQWFDRDVLMQTFLDRTQFMRATGTPIWVGEFGPVYTGEPARDDMRYALLRDQLEIYAEHGASWSIWTYKDLGLQGVVSARSDSPYVQRIAAVLAKKERLATDSWGGDDRQIRYLLDPIEKLVAAEFPNFSPYPWGPRQWIGRIVREILLGEPMAEEFGNCFAGVSPAAAAELAESFAFAACQRNERLAGLLHEFAHRPHAV
ncbi:MAG TPA: glycoside hydrolase family 5 protein [Streptosporangiaceae bacterium]